MKKMSNKRARRGVYSRLRHKGERTWAKAFREGKSSLKSPRYVRK